MSKRQRKPEHYKTITREVASHIFEAHRDYPQLGHDGLLKVLKDAGFRVDSAEMKSFLEQNDIHPENWQVAWGHIPGRFDAVRDRLKGAIIVGGKD